jgi:hypothetical protein
MPCGVDVEAKMANRVFGFPTVTRFYLPTGQPQYMM